MRVMAGMVAYQEINFAILLVGSWQWVVGSAVGSWQWAVGSAVGSGQWAVGSGVFYQRTVTDFSMFIRLQFFKEHFLPATGNINS